MQCTNILMYSSTTLTLNKRVEAYYATYFWVGLRNRHQKKICDYRQCQMANKQGTRNLFIMKETSKRKSHFKLHAKMQNSFTSCHTKRVSVSFCRKKMKKKDSQPIPPLFALRVMPVKQINSLPLPWLTCRDIPAHSAIHYILCCA